MKYSSTKWDTALGPKEYTSLLPDNQAWVASKARINVYILIVDKVS